MALFAPAYEIVKQNEGCYANHSADLGGETYAGIARNYHPTWSGWTVVDFRKQRTDLPPLKTNECITGIEPRVTEFYQNLWNRSRAGQINNQAVANIYFDFFVLHSQAVRYMQQVLNESFSKNLVEDNLIGPLTLAAINSVDPVKLHDAYKAKRISVHMDRVRLRPDQSVFLEGWLARANLFPSLGTGGTIVTGVGALLLIVGMIYLSTSNTKPKTSKKSSK